MDRLLAVLGFVLPILGLVSIIVFFLFQLLECHRSPYGVFVGPITRKEFKVLSNLLMNAEMEHKRDFLMNEAFIFDGGKFKLQKHSWRDIYTLNGVTLSYFQEKALMKLVKRKKLQAHLLTKAGQILFTKGNNE